MEAPDLAAAAAAESGAVVVEGHEDGGEAHAGAELVRVADSVEVLRREFLVAAAPDAHPVGIMKG